MLQFPGLSSVLQVLEKYFGQSTEVYQRQDAEMFTIIHETISNSQNGRSLITIRIKPSGIFMINLELTPEDGASFDSPKFKVLEKEIKKCLKSTKGKIFCPIRRGGPTDYYRYMTSSGVHSCVTFSCSLFLPFLS